MPADLVSDRQAATMDAASPDDPALVDPVIRRADARFLLPYPVTRAHVLGADTGWTEALAVAGIEVTAAPELADLVVASGATQREAMATNVAALLLEGRCQVRPLRRAGYEVAQCLVLPDVMHPELVLSVTARRASRYAVRRRVAGAGGARRALVGLVARAVARAPSTLRPSSLLTIATRAPSRPYVLQEARRLGLVDAASWYLLLGSSRELAERRLAFVMFRPGRSHPSWVVKVARVPGLEDSFARDERGVRALATAAPELAHRAAHILGQASAGGLPFSVETAAVGDRLTEVLKQRGAAGRPLVGAIASWLVDLGVQTRRAANPTVDDQWLREVLGGWDGGPHVAAAVKAALRQVPAVLTHGDLGTWNVVAHGREFTVIDWESAQPIGRPLTDLLHLLGDACAQMAGRASRRERAGYLVSLFRGDEALSSFAFKWVRRAVYSLDLPTASVGPLATLTWLERADLAGAATGADGSSPAVDLARRWLEDPALGIGWRAWA